MAKKCIKHEMTGKIRRVNEHEASKLTAHHRVIEELRHDIAVQLDSLDRNDKVLMIVDSLGNLASKIVRGLNRPWRQ